MSDVRIFGDKLVMLKNGIQFRHDIQTKLVSSTQRDTFLGAFAKLRKASHVCHPQGTARLPLDGFS
jgi:hypothetical protein